MKRPDPDSPPSIDWTLQSPQVSDASLVWALVEAYSVEVFRLALAVLRNEGAARQVVRLTFTQAVQRRKNYWGDVPLRLWLLSIALQACRRKLGWRGLLLTYPGGALRARPVWAAHLKTSLTHTDLLLTLRYELNLSADEIAYLINGRLVEDGTLSTAAKLRRARQARSPKWIELENQAQKHSLSLSHVHTFVLARSDGNLYPGGEAVIDRHLRLCETCRNFAARVAEAEAGLKHPQTDAQHHAGLTVIEQERIAERSALEVVRRRHLHSTGLALRHVFFGLFIIIFLGVSIQIAGAGGPEVKTPSRARTPTPTQPGLAARRTDNITYSYQVQEGDTLNSVAEMAGVPVSAIRDLNHIKDGSVLRPPRELKIPFSRTLFIQAAQQTIDPAPLLPPLNLESSRQEILERMKSNNKYWQTLWLDMHQVFNGQPGYLGPPLSTYRMQLWVRRPELATISYSYSSPARSWGMGLVYGHRVGSLLFMKNPAEDISSGQLLGNAEANMLESQFWFFQWMGEDFLEQAEQHLAKYPFRIVRMDSWLDRQVIVFDIRLEDNFTVSRMWVDASLGLILRQQSFYSNNLDWPVMEQAVHGLAVDQPIPLQIFDPMVNPPEGFAVDYTGRVREEESSTEIYQSQFPRPSIPLKRSFPPAGLDLATARLLFVWPESRQPDDKEKLQPVVGVYLEGYYLGDLIFFEENEIKQQELPQSIVFNNCDRSPDGRLVIITITPVNDPAVGWSNPERFWIRLDRPLAAKRLNTDASQVVFSPDGNQIAYWRSRAGTSGVLHILDLHSEKEERVAIQGEQRPDNVDNLAWSPDGRSMAMIMNYWNDNRLTFVVVDIETGEPVYSEPFVWGEELSDAAPVHDWGIAYPVPSTWLKGCYLP